MSLSSPPPPSPARATRGSHVPRQNISPFVKRPAGSLDTTEQRPEQKERATGKRQPWPPYRDCSRELPEPSPYKRESGSSGTSADQGARVIFGRNKGLVQRVYFRFKKLQTIKPKAP